MSSSTIPVDPSCQTKAAYLPTLPALPSTPGNVEVDTIATTFPTVRQDASVLELQAGLHPPNGSSRTPEGTNVPSPPHSNWFAAPNLNPDLNLPAYTNSQAQHAAPELRLSHPQPAPIQQPYPQKAAKVLTPSRTLPTPPAENPSGHYRTHTHTHPNPNLNVHTTPTVTSTSSLYSEPTPIQDLNAGGSLTYDSFWSGFRTPGTAPTTVSPPLPPFPGPQTLFPLDMTGSIAHNLGLASLVGGVGMGDSQ